MHVKTGRLRRVVAEGFSADSPEGLDSHQILSPCVPRGWGQCRTGHGPAESGLKDPFASSLVSNLVVGELDGEVNHPVGWSRC